MHTINPRTIFVTGGCGFIGSHFTRMMLQRGYRVVNIDVLTYAGRNHPEDRARGAYRFVEADIGDETTVARLLSKERPAAVVHFAAESHVDRSITGPEIFLDTNVGGTFRLLERCRTYHAGLTPESAERFRFLHISTDEVFGHLGPQDPPFREDTPIAPRSPYSASKAAAEHFVMAAFHTFGLPAMILRGSNNYGPRQLPEKLIPLMIEKAYRREPLPVYGTGGNVRDWLFVEDFCEAAARVLDAGRPGRGYNAGGGNERTNLDMVRMICALIDERTNDDGPPRASLIEFVTDRPGHDFRYAIDFSRLQTELGWSPRVNLEAGLRETVLWYTGRLEGRTNQGGANYVHV